MNEKFYIPSLKVFLVVVLCLENSFWNSSKSISFIEKFSLAFDLYEETGTQEKLDSEDLNLPNSSVFRVLLKHRLPHSNNSSILNQ